MLKENFLGLRAKTGTPVADDVRFTPEIWQQQKNLKHTVLLYRFFVARRCFDRPTTNCEPTQGPNARIASYDHS
jgi:hypothetical protein